MSDSSHPSPHPSLEDAQQLLGAAAQLLEQAVTSAKELTSNGNAIDDYQVLTERIAYASTEAVAAHEVIESILEIRNEGRSNAMLELTAVAAVGDLVTSLRDRLWFVIDDLGIGDEAIDKAFPPEIRKLLRRATNEALYREIGADIAETRGVNHYPLDEMHEQVREQVREYAANEVMPHAEHIHRTDDLVPESFISGMAELGFFGLSVPEQYGGVEMGNLAMILTTEELSRASLAGAGSLITRPEILTKALLGGGTEEQKQEWLPKLASGEVMVGISVTEPDIGSDVSSAKCRAERATVDGVEGWVINGPKSWCTFAGRADVLALLARTDPDFSKRAKGLSLFIVPKESFTTHEFETTQPGGGRMAGKADATPGYRGMHSYTLQLENYFVPADHLVGGEKGEGRGFYLQMAGFAAGRLQTSGRGCGLAQAAIGARAITYAAARAFDEDERAAAPLAAQAKLLACDVAVNVAQQGQLMHGGWGYAEEYPISRYVVDASVLPIFEGVKPILELKVIGRAILAG